MKKQILLTASLILTLLLSACGGGTSTQTPASSTSTSASTTASTEASTPEVPSEFTVAAGDDQVYSELTFEQDITIHLDPEATADNRSQILFSACTFNGNIQVIGDRSAFLRFGDGCVFGENCEITVTETADGATDGMTLDDDLVKLLFTDTGAVIHAESICNVLCMNGEGITVDDIEYSKSDFPDNTGFCVATYFENGQKKVFTLGVDE